MQIEVITIGDEILCGNIVDTNFAWIGDQLWMRGYDLIWHTTVADEPERIKQALLAATERSELVLVTGGLGPTTDDITLKCAAEAFGVPHLHCEEALQVVRRFFQKTGREMSPNNRNQALMPQGGKVIENDVGTAPGCHFKFKNTDYFFMPGVPQEMKPQVLNTVIPFLQVKETAQFHYRLFRCYGLPEAQFDQQLREAKELQKIPGLRLAFRVSFPELFIKISSTDRGRGAESVAEAERVIKEKIGSYIYAEGDNPIEKVVGQLLTDRKLTLAVAESCTGGFLANMITDAPGSSAYFERGVVTYSNRSKTELLGVSEKLIQEKGAVSSEVAIAMAEGIQRVAGTNYGIGITGIAGPTGATADKPLGTVHIALAYPGGVKQRQFQFFRDRPWFKVFTAHAALHMLRRKILGLSRN